jgi:hypothetical protein
MAETNIVAGLFGMNPQMYAEQQRRSALQEGIDLAKLTPGEAGAAMTYAGAKGFAGALGGAMGIQDPALIRMTQRNQLLQEMDISNPESLIQVAKKAASIGDSEFAMALVDKARQAQESIAQTQQRRAAEQSSLATAAKAQFGLKQEEQLRDELSKLGPNPTQEQIISIVTKYGPADKVLATLQGSADRAAQREQSVQLQRERIDAQIQVAKDRGATQKEIAQMQIDGRQQIAQLVASLKGPSAAVLKAQEKAEKIAEGKAGLSDTLEVAKTLVNDIAKLGGMTSTAKQPLANLVTSLGTGTVGQMAGQAFGTPTQAKRDELKSVRLQLLNAVKEATGMSAQQLNSNVELKTWLDSLGSEKMTKEANLAIINNISNRYLKGAMNAPEDVGTASNPIVLK